MRCDADKGHEVRREEQGAMPSPWDIDDGHICATLLLA